MPSEPAAAPIRLRHVLSVLRGLALFVAALGGWMAGGVVPSMYLPGQWAPGWMLGYVVTSGLVFLVWACASMEAEKEAENRAE